MRNSVESSPRREEDIGDGSLSTSLRQDFWTGRGAQVHVQHNAVSVYAAMFVIAFQKNFFIVLHSDHPALKVELVTDDL